MSYVGLADETPKLVSQADIIVICAPLTPATRGLFNAAMFARMKKDAMFVNWARAEITVPEDLAAALKAGTIGSAALNWATSKTAAERPSVVERAEPDPCALGRDWSGVDNGHRGGAGQWRPGPHDE